MLEELSFYTQNQLSNIAGQFASTGYYKKIKLNKEIYDNLFSEAKHKNFSIKTKFKDLMLSQLNQNSSISTNITNTSVAKKTVKPKKSSLKNKSIKNMSAIEIDIKFMKCYESKYHNSVERNIEFKLTFAQFKKLLKTKYCFYTGKPLTYDFGITDREFNHVSLERLDSSKGYTKENTVAVCHGLNQLRAKLDLETHSNKFELIDVLNMVTKLVQIHN